MHELVIIETGHIDARFKHEILLFTISRTNNQWMLQAMLALQENITSIFQNTLTRNTFFSGTVTFTGQLLERENPKRYYSYYLKNLFCEGLQNGPTLFTKKYGHVEI